MSTSDVDKYRTQSCGVDRVTCGTRCVPGYGREQVEELRWQTFALGATLAVITIFVFCLLSQCGAFAFTPVGVGSGPLAGSSRGTIFHEVGDAKSRFVGQGGCGRGGTGDRRVGNGGLEEVVAARVQTRRPLR
jgi:hypothetical protein